MLEFASAEEEKAQVSFGKAIKEGNAHEAKAYAENVVLWRTVRDRAYQEASEDERAEWMRKQTGEGT